MILFSLAVAFVASSAISYINCGSDDDLEILQYGRLTDMRICESIARMHRYLDMDQDMTPEERCKRYAVLLYKTDGAPYEATVFSVLKMDEDTLDSQYKEINPGMMSWIYMVSIDRYRITELAPPFLELIKCLRLLDTAYARSYLANGELMVIESLYKKVLGLPDPTSNVDYLDLRTFNTAFQRNIRDLFSKYLDVDRIGKCGLTEDQTCLRPSAIDRSADDQASTSNKEAVAQEQQPVTARRQTSDNRKRERSRLNQQRLRLFHPNLVRERGRRHQRSWNQRKKQKDFIKLRSDDKSDDSKIVRRAIVQKRYREKQRQRQIKLLARYDLEKSKPLDQILLEHLSQREEEQSQQPQTGVPGLPSVRARLAPFTAVAPQPRVKKSRLPKILPPTDNPSISSSHPDEPLDNTEALLPDQSLDQFIDSFGETSLDTLLDPDLDDYFEVDDYLIDCSIEGEQDHVDDVGSTMNCFEPESEEERRTHQDLIDSGSQVNDSNTVMQIVSDPLRREGSSVDPQTTVPAISSPDRDRQGGTI